MKSILVVDDEPVVRTIVARGLREGGYEVAAAPNGAAALELLLQRPFDLFITDLVMPGMTGYELIENLHEQLPTLPILQLIAQLLDASSPPGDHLTLSASDPLVYSVRCDAPPPEAAPA